MVHILVALALASGPFGDGPWPNASGSSVSPDGVCSTDLFLADNLALSHGNTSVLPDYSCEYVSASTAYVCTNQMGEVYRVTDGGVLVAFAGGASFGGDLDLNGNATVAGQVSHETNTVTCATATDDFDINWANGNIAFLDMEDCDQDANDVNAPTNPVEGSSIRS